MDIVIKIAPILSFIGLLVAFAIYVYIKGKSEGLAKMKEVAALIHDGAMVYLKRQYLVLSIFVLLVSILMGSFITKETALAYIL